MFRLDLKLERTSISSLDTEKPNMILVQGGRNHLKKVKTGQFL